MKISMVSDLLAHRPFEAMLGVARDLGVEGVEMNTGNWSSAPHFDLEGLLADATVRRGFPGPVRSADGRARRYQRWPRSARARSIMLCHSCAATCAHKLG